MHLDAWLSYQQTLHPRGIDLGLARVREVAVRLGIGRPAAQVITVGGTNGKGSTVALLEAMLIAAGLRMGCYTSPHLLHYRERLRLDGRELTDAGWIEAFEAVEKARDETGLTYFEFGTLAALWLMQRAALDVAVLEVGLGGRLDAVNIIDADVAVVTTVALDHQDYLGHELDGIGAEKAGIARCGRPLVVGDPSPPNGLLATAESIGARLLLAEKDFSVEPAAAAHWVYRGNQGCRFDLPLPGLAAPAQLQNAAAAITALLALPNALAIGEAEFAAGLRCAIVPGRLQHCGGDPALILDVAHNPQAATQLAAWLDAHPIDGRSVAVFSALGDKDIEGIVAALAGCFSAWHVAGLDGIARGLSVSQLRERIQALEPERLRWHEAVEEALAAARVEAGPGGRVLVFGSFHTVAVVLALVQPTAA